MGPLGCARARSRVRVGPLLCCGVLRCRNRRRHAELLPRSRRQDRRARMRRVTLVRTELAPRLDRRSRRAQRLRLASRVWPGTGSCGAAFIRGVVRAWMTPAWMVLAWVMLASMRCGWTRLGSARRRAPSGTSKAMARCMSLPMDKDPFVLALWWCPLRMLARTRNRVRT